MWPEESIGTDVMEGDAKATLLGVWDENKYFRIN